MLAGVVAGCDCTHSITPLIVKQDQVVRLDGIVLKINCTDLP